MYLPTHLGSSTHLFVMGVACNLPIHFGGDGHLSTHVFWEGIGDPSAHLFGKRVPPIYPPIWEGMAISLPISLGEGGNLSAHLFGKGMPLIYSSIWEGVANYLPIYLGGDGHVSTHPFGKEYPLICEGMASNLPTYLEGACHSSTQ